MKPSTSPVVLVTCLFVLMMVTGASCRPPPMRCRCIAVMATCPREDIEKLERLPAGPHCSRDQIIATLKNNKKRCLDPKSPAVKLCIERFAARNETKTSKTSP